jgi:hypothetical protein
MVTAGGWVKLYVALTELEFASVTITVNTPAGILLSTDPVPLPGSHAKL